MIAGSSYSYFPLHKIRRYIRRVKSEPMSKTSSKVWLRSPSNNRTSPSRQTNFCRATLLSILSRERLRIRTDCSSRTLYTPRSLFSLTTYTRVLFTPLTPCVSNFSCYFSSHSSYKTIGAPYPPSTPSSLLASRVTSKSCCL